MWTFFSMCKAYCHIGNEEYAHVQIIIYNQICDAHSRRQSFSILEICIISMKCLGLAELTSDQIMCSEKDYNI